VRQPQHQSVTGYDRDGERVVGGVPNGGAHDARSVGRAVGGLVARVVLVHHQGVEQRAGAGRPLDVRQAQVLVRQQGCGVVLQPGQQVTERGDRFQPQPDRDRVDEQTEHVLCAGQVRRAARDRGAEHHVGATGEPAKQNPPGPLQQGVEGETAGPGDVPQPGGQVRVELQADQFRLGRWRGPRRRYQHRRLVEPA
jgi:hypothetical protein